MSGSVFSVCLTRKKKTVKRVTRPIVLSVCVFVLLTAASHGGALAEDAVFCPAAPRESESTPLVVHTVFDDRIKKDAFTVEVPKQWSFEGEVVWRTDVVTLADLKVSSVSPEDGSLVRLIPTQPYVSFAKGMRRRTQGGIYRGRRVEPKILEPDEFFVQKLQQYLLVSESAPEKVIIDDLPDVTALVASMYREEPSRPIIRARAATVRYPFKGRQMRETFLYVVLYRGDTGVPGVTLWGADRIIAFRAPDDEFCKRLQLLSQSAASVEFNADWYTAYRQVVSQWEANAWRTQRSAGEINVYIAQAQNAISRDVRREYAKERSVWERIQRALAGALFRAE